MSITAEGAHDGARPPSRLSRLIKRYGKILPAFVFLGLFFVLPVSMLLGLSFVDAEGGLSFEHYQRLWDTPVYAKVLGITLRTAAWTTVLCIVGGYPIAYLRATVAKTTRARLTILVLMPFWTSFLARTFAWIVRLGRKGALNNFLLDSPVWINAALRSFVVAILSSSLGMLLGVPAAFMLARSSFAGKGAVFAFLVSPIIIPNIFIAVGLFFLFSRLGLTGTTVGLILGHTVLAIPYVVITVLAVVKGYDQHLDMAAWTLGANRRQTLTRITLPMIRSGMIAAFMFAFIISFDELTIALFVTGGEVTTLPKQMWDDALLRVSPSLAAVATLLLLFMSVFILVSEIMKRRAAKLR